MHLSYFLTALIASTVTAQNSTDPASAEPAVPTAPAAPSAPDAPSSPASSVDGNTIVIISPTGNLGYKTGDSLQITWNNNGDTDINGVWENTVMTFELADASLGANKVTPIGVSLNGTATVQDLQLTTTIPAGVPAGMAYCVRSNIKGLVGFTYFFSPSFPINAGTGVQVGAPPAAKTSSPAAVGSSITSKASTAAITTVVATTTSSAVTIALSFSGMFLAGLIL
ncbi:hypothetical protein HDU98_010919 [Podochytrium sp. JEL0797]|nr:hypothetical protein HDU98_010919 [Podochytrium sp. JEL0797]